MANVGRYHGRTGILYVARTSTGSAEPAVNITDWNQDYKANRVDVTAMGDTQTAYVQGFSDSSKSYSGFQASGSKGLLAAAVDGLARSWYFYPDASTATSYFFGSDYFDISLTNSASDAAKVSGTAVAASPGGTVGLT